MTCSNFSDDATLLAFSSGEDWSLGGTASKMRQNVVKIYVRACEKEDVFKQKKWEELQALHEKKNQETRIRL